MSVSGSCLVRSCLLFENVYQANNDDRSELYEVT